MIFDENQLRKEIARIWGEHGAHMEVYDALLKRAQVKHELLTAEEVLAELSDMEVPHYKGDGNHSVFQLEQLCREFIEYIHQANTKEMYTREEVYLVASRVGNSVASILRGVQPHKNLDDLINSEIDTVKLF